MGIFDRLFSGFKGSKAKKGANPAASKLRFESLEERTLLTAVPNDWGRLQEDIYGVVNENGASAIILNVSESDYDSVVGFVISASDGSSLNPGAITITDAEGNDVSESVKLYAATDYGQTKDSVFIAKLASGDYTIKASGEDETTGDFTCALFLPGDNAHAGKLTDGDYQKINAQISATRVHQRGTFTQATVKFYQSRYGIDITRSVSDLYVAAYDLNMDGHLTDADAKLAHSIYAGKTTIVAQNDDVPPESDVTIGEGEEKVELTRDTEVVVYDSLLAENGVVIDVSDSSKLSALAIELTDSAGKTTTLSLDDFEDPTRDADLTYHYQYEWDLSTYTDNGDFTIKITEATDVHGNKGVDEESGLDPILYLFHYTQKNLDEDKALAVTCKDFELLDEGTVFQSLSVTEGEETLTLEDAEEGVLTFASGSTFTLAYNSASEVTGGTYRYGGTSLKKGDKASVSCAAVLGEETEARTYAFSVNGINQAPEWNDDAQFNADIDETDKTEGEEKTYVTSVTLLPKDYVIDDDSEVFYFNQITVDDVDYSLESKGWKENQLVITFESGATLTLTREVDEEGKGVGIVSALYEVYGRWNKETNLPEGEKAVDEFDFIVSDAEGESTTTYRTFTFNITGVNDAPVLTEKSLSILYADLIESPETETYYYMVDPSENASDRDEGDSASISSFILGETVYGISGNKFTLGEETFDSLTSGEATFTLSEGEIKISLTSNYVDSLRWEHVGGEDDILLAEFSYAVTDKWEAVSNNASFKLSFTPEDEKAIVTPPPKQTVHQNADPDAEGYIKLDGQATWKADHTGYTFTVDSLKNAAGEEVLEDGFFKLAVDEEAKTVTFYVLKEKLADYAVGDYTVGFSWTDDQGEVKDTGTAEFTLSVISITAEVAPLDLGTIAEDETEVQSQTLAPSAITADVKGVLYTATEFAADPDSIAWQAVVTSGGTELYTLDYLTEFESGSIKGADLLAAMKAAFACDASGKFTFTPQDGLFSFLRDGETLTLTLEYTLNDVKFEDAEGTPLAGTYDGIKGAFTLSITGQNDDLAMEEGVDPAIAKTVADLSQAIADVDASDGVAIAENRYVYESDTDHFITLAITSGTLTPAPVTEIYQGAVTFSGSLVSADNTLLGGLLTPLPATGTTPVTYSFTLADASGRTISRSIIYTVTGLNETPSASDVSATFDLRESAHVENGVVIPYAGTDADLQYGEYDAAKAGDDQDPEAETEDVDLYSVTVLNAQGVSETITDFSEAIPVYQKMDGNNVYCGYLTAAETETGFTELRFFASGDYVKWELAKGEEMTLEIGYQVRDVILNASGERLAEFAVSEKATAEVTIIGAFDPLEIDEIPNQTIAEEAAGDEWIPLSNLVTFLSDKGTDYAFEITQITNQATSEQVAASAMKAVNNGDRTATLYVLKSALGSGLTAGDYAVTLKYSYANEEQGISDEGRGGFVLTVTAESRISVTPYAFTDPITAETTDPVTLDLNANITVTEVKSGEKVDSFTAADASSMVPTLVLTTSGGDVHSGKEEIAEYLGLSSAEYDSWLAAIAAMATIQDGNFAFQNVPAAFKDIPSEDSLAMTFTYQITGYVFGGESFETSVSGQMTLTLVGTNDAPYGVTDHTGRFELETGSLTYDDGQEPPLNLLEGVTDPEGDAMTAVIRSIDSGVYAIPEGAITVDNEGNLQVDVEALYEVYEDLPAGTTAQITVIFYVKDTHGAESEDGQVIITVVGEDAEEVNKIQEIAAQTKGINETFSLAVTDYFTGDFGENVAVTFMSLESEVLELDAVDILSGYVYDKASQSLVFTMLTSEGYSVEMDLAAVDVTVTVTSQTGRTSVSSTFRLTFSDQITAKVSLVATVDPTEEGVTELKTGASKFGTFYYLGADDVPETDYEELAQANEFYLEVWVQDSVFKLTQNQQFLTSLQVQINYDNTSGNIASVELEDIYAGKTSLQNFLYYDTEETLLKAFQVTWLYSQELDWSLIEPITNGDNAYLLARLTVTTENMAGTDFSVTLSGVTDAESPFTDGWYYVRTGETKALDESQIATVNVQFPTSRADLPYAFASQAEKLCLPIHPAAKDSAMEEFLMEAAPKSAADSMDADAVLDGLAQKSFTVEEEEWSLDKFFKDYLN